MEQERKSRRKRQRKAQVKQEQKSNKSKILETFPENAITVIYAEIDQHGGPTDLYY